MNDIYPSAAGFKEKGGTSEAAAHRFTRRARSIRLRVLDYLREHGMATSEQVTNGLGDALKATDEARRLNTVKARLSELVALYLAFKTERKTRNSTGFTAVYYRALTVEERAFVMRELDAEQRANLFEPMTADEVAAFMDGLGDADQQAVLAQNIRRDC